MNILLTLHATEPPAGNVRMASGNCGEAGEDEARAIEFVGWLGLLRALSEVLGSSNDWSGAGQ